MRQYFLMRNLHICCKQQMCHQQSIIWARSCFCLEFLWDRVVSVVAFAVTEIGQAPQFFLLFYFPKIFLNFFLNFFGWIYMTSSCICGGFSSNGYWPAATIWPQSHKEMGEARILTTETVSNKKTNQNILPENYSFAFLANPNQCNMLAWSHLWKL